MRAVICSSRIGPTYRPEFTLFRGQDWKILDANELNNFGVLYVINFDILNQMNRQYCQKLDVNTEIKKMLYTIKCCNM